MSIHVRDGNGDDQVINTLPALGQATRSASLPVAIASDDTQFGADVTAAAQLTGGSGVRGWLSGLFISTGAPTDAAWASGSGSVVSLLKAIATTILTNLKILRPPLTYTTVASSPFTLTASWVKVCTTTSATKGLRLAPIAGETIYDIEWVAVAAAAAAPTDTYGEPILGGEDFAAGLPIGDIYLKSASGRKAIVRTGA